jgi:hypothetical protein
LRATRASIRTFGCARKTPEHVGQDRFAEILLQPDPHPAVEIHAAHGRGRFVVQFDHAARVAQHRVARVGQRQPAPGLHEQRRAGLLLELADLRAHRRRRARDAIGRLREAAEVDARHQAAQRRDIEIGTRKRGVARVSHRHLDHPVLSNDSSKTFRFSG